MRVTDKTNENLQSSRDNKADEFYTTYEDIEQELSLYKGVFENKVVYCPCDDYKVSNFYKYFIENFNNLGLKKIIATGYHNPDGILAIYDGNVERYEYCCSKIDTKTKEYGVCLKWENCDFRSEFVKKYFDEADIIVTNPPFSLSKEFMNMLITMNKQFIVVGNINAITYKGIFSHFVDGSLRLGGSIHSGDRKFYIPDDYPLDGTACGVDDNKQRYIRVKGVRWFTNIVYEYPEVKHTILSVKYDSSIHKKYDTYDAINANTMKEIPIDYYDEIGAPITVLDKMNKDSNIEFVDRDGNIYYFKLIGQLNGGANKDNYDFAKPIIDGKCKFKRVLIKRVN